jgi:hypothetical protein
MASAMSAKEFPKNPANHLITAKTKLLRILTYVVRIALSAFFDMISNFTQNTENIPIVVLPCGHKVEGIVINKNYSNG